MKILKKKKKKKKNFFFFVFFFEIGNFFFKLGKKSPKSHWERGRISAPEDTKKIPVEAFCCALKSVLTCMQCVYFQVCCKFSA